MEDIKAVKNELQNIIVGDEYKGEADLIKTTQTFLKSGNSPGTKTETKFSTRAEEERALITYADSRNLWIQENDIGAYVTEGAEQIIYFRQMEGYVIKLADAIFYTTWLDYFNNLLLHNAIFQNTAYGLMGFMLKNEKLFAVVKQSYIHSTEPTNLNNVKEFLNTNGFSVKKNNDYFHPYLGIILEDLHDENVLTNDGILFFVDTVFYITDDFYK